MEILAEIPAVFRPAYSFIGMAAIFLGLFFAVGGFLHVRRRRFKASRLDPFTTLPLRPPGESLRLKIELISEEFDTHLTMTGIIGFATIGYLSGVPRSDLDRVGPFALALMIGAMGYFAFSCFKLQTKLWNHKVGFVGERVVGEALNQLMRDGFEVFHDIPFEGYNVDHVIVSPPGLFVFETKSARKPAEIAGKAKATVVYDGNLLHFPKNKSGKFGLGQAQRNADNIAVWLSKATGRKLEAQPVLVYPGWWIDRRGGGSVSVLNPEEIREALPTKRVLDKESIKAAAYQLSEKCRLVAAA